MDDHVSALEEDLLIYALRGGLAPVERTERCACGGEIRAVVGNLRSIEAAVGTHNESATHRSWRLDMER